ncbi:MAG: protein kinase [Polyangiales bacterium]
MAQRTPVRAFEPEEVILGKYRVIRVVGQGGYGSVLEAENLRTTRHVAIKVVDGEALARSPTAARRLRVEARAAAKLAHPNSVDVLDLEEEPDGSMFFVQEYLRGETLHARLEREHKLPWREALSLMIPVMSALADAHRKGIVHRDVKPENIFLSEAAPGILVPKIIDFGIARVFDSSELRLTQMDRVVGTPWYMSPEQAAGERDLDGQTDVWAVGVVLYEALAGASPCVANNVEALMRAIARGDLTPLRLRAPEVPANVAECVERALVLDRKRRYATMTDFIDAALACMGSRTVGIGHFTGASSPVASAAAPSAAPAAKPSAEHDDAAVPGDRAHSLTPSLRPSASHPRTRDALLAVAGMVLTALAGFAVGSLANAAPPSPQMVTAPMRLAPALTETPHVAAAPPAITPPVAASPVVAPSVTAPSVTAPSVTAPSPTPATQPVIVMPPVIASPATPPAVDAAPTAASSLAQRNRRRRRR